MTRADYITYLRTRNNVIQTTKSVLLVGYWTIRKANWIRVSGFAAVLLGIQILTNAMLLNSVLLTGVSFVFIVVGLKITK